LSGNTSVVKRPSIRKGGSDKACDCLRNASWWLRVGQWGECTCGALLHMKNYCVTPHTGKDAEHERQKLTERGITIIRLKDILASR
jgi:hypothetical protein